VSDEAILDSAHPAHALHTANERVSLPLEDRPLQRHTPCDSRHLDGGRVADDRAEARAHSFDDDHVVGAVRRQAGSQTCHKASSPVPGVARSRLDGATGLANRSIGFVERHGAPAPTPLAVKQSARNGTDGGGGDQRLQPAHGGLLPVAGDPCTHVRTPAPAG
jgi:hypothetical protein